MDAVLLAAGIGSRLRPYTHNIPKCLMPIRKRPLLDYWLAHLIASDVSKIFINTFHLRDKVNSYVNSLPDEIRELVTLVDEPYLMGTAGSLKRIIKKYGLTDDIFVAHADNWCDIDLPAFIKSSIFTPSDNLISIMCFHTINASSSGILSPHPFKGDLIIGYDEKPECSVLRPLLANGAVYFFPKSTVMDIEILAKGSDSDIGRDWLPTLVGKISYCSTRNFFRDVGTIDQLKAAQNDFPENEPRILTSNEWLRDKYFDWLRDSNLYDL